MRIQKVYDPHCGVHQQFPPFHFYNGTLNLSFPAYKLRKIASWLEAVPIVTDLIRTSWILMVWINNEKSGYFDLTWVTYIVEPLLFMYLLLEQCTQTGIFAPPNSQIDISIGCSAWKYLQFWLLIVTHTYHFILDMMKKYPI